MKDVGHEETEKILEEIEKRISAEYAQAEKEIAEKLDDYLKKFRVKDELKLKAVENGMISKEEYEQWRVGQVMMGKRWAELRDSLAEDFTNADKIARSIAYNHMPEVYAINHDYGTFQVEKASQMDTSYTLYDRQAFEQLVKNEDTFIPAPGRKVSRDIKEGKALAWNKKQVQSVMMQGLLQGESIPKLATRLANTVGESDRKAAIRNARTMTTGVQNAGRMASYDRANKMGIKTQKQWLATLDARTRHWHASLDGEVMDNDEPFVNEFGEIMYPGDPEAAPVNIFNCRCTLIASIRGFERDVSNTDLRHDDHLEDMTYDEWREGHYDQKSDPITKQDDIAETMQRIYGNEYATIKNSSLDEADSPFYNGWLANKDKSQETINRIRQEFIEGLKNVPNPKIRKLLLDSDLSVRYEISKNSKSGFRRGLVVIGKGTNSSTLAHELFHNIDWKNKITKKGALSESVRNDYAAIENKANALGIDIRTYLERNYKHAFDSKGLKEKYRGISDIVHGCSKGKVYLGFGHSTKGYWDREKQLEKETLAQSGRMLYDNDENVLEMFKKEFPATYSEIMKILEGL